MRILASVSPRTLNTDPAPWEVDGEHVTTRTAMDLPYTPGVVNYAPRAQYTPATVHPYNPILAAFRDDDSADSAYGTHEWLFQLARHWAQWQDARTGTFPLDYSDPSGQCDRATSADTGEDSVFWDVDEIIRTELVARGAIIHDDADDPGAYTWERGTGESDAGEAVTDMIVHAVAVLARLDDWYTSTDRGI